VQSHDPTKNSRQWPNPTAAEVAGHGFAVKRPFDKDDAEREREALFAKIGDIFKPKVHGKSRPGRKVVAEKIAGSSLYQSSGTQNEDILSQNIEG
jgi:hypothetical protein